MTLAVLSAGSTKIDTCSGISTPSALDKVVCTNSEPREEHLRACPKLEVLDVFAEVSWL